MIDLSPTSTFLNFARRVIAVESTPGESNSQVINILKEFAESLGLPCDIFEEIQNGITQNNLIVRPVSSKSDMRQFLLQAHLDTLEAGNYGTWKKNEFNPFQLVIENEILYGLGVSKSKLDALLKIFVLGQYAKSEFKNLVPVMMGTFGAQTGMQGLLRLIRKNQIHARYALVAEATQSQLIHASKGFATVEILIPFSDEERVVRESKILSESASTQSKVFSSVNPNASSVSAAEFTEANENAATKLFDYIRRLPENMAIIEIDCGTHAASNPTQALLEIDSVMSLRESMISKLNRTFDLVQSIESKMKEIRDEEFFPSYSTLSIGSIRTENDFVRLSGSCFIVPTVQADDFDRWITELKTGFEGLGAEFRVLDYKRPYRLDEKSVFVKTAQNELAQIQNKSSHQSRSLASTNEASLLSRLGVDCLCFGAGFLADHRQTRPEHVNLQELQQAAQFYARMIERFCL